MHEEYMSSSEITREIADLKIRLSLQKEFEEEVADLMELCEEPATETIHDFESQMLQRIPRMVKENEKQMHRTRTISKWCKIAVIASMFLVVSFGSALAALKMVRVGLLKLDAQEYEGYTSYGLTQSGEHVFVPDGWEGDFYPAYIPKGFEVIHVSENEVEYRDSSQNSLYFSEDKYGVRTSVDTENAEVHCILLDGLSATVIEKEDWVTIVWAKNNRFFLLDIQGDQDAALQVMASITYIR